MKKLVMVALVAASLAVPMAASAAKVYRQVPVQGPAPYYQAPVACAPACQPACQPSCNLCLPNPCAIVGGVLSCVGNTVCGLFSCLNPCQ